MTVVDGDVELDDADDVFDPDFEERGVEVFPAGQGHQVVGGDGDEARHAVVGLIPAPQMARKDLFLYFYPPS